jgi:DNA invertase Pin-like site-specific DNA recombinase
MVLTVPAGLAEVERELIRLSADGGRRAARERGVTFGRPPELRPDRQAPVARLLQEGRPASEAARALNVHPATVCRRVEVPVLRPRPRAS